MSDVIPTALDVFIEEVRTIYKDDELTNQEILAMVRNALIKTIDKPTTPKDDKEIFKLLLKEFDSKY